MLLQLCEAVPTLAPKTQQTRCTSSAAGHSGQGCGPAVHMSDTLQKLHWPYDTLHVIKLGSNARASAPLLLHTRVPPRHPARSLERLLGAQALGKLGQRAKGTLASGQGLHAKACAGEDGHRVSLPRVTLASCCIVEQDRRWQLHSAKFQLRSPQQSWIAPPTKEGNHCQAPVLELRSLELEGALIVAGGQAQGVEVAAGVAPAGCGSPCARPASQPATNTGRKQGGCSVGPGTGPRRCGAARAPPLQAACGAHLFSGLSSLFL
jgi:hypothetical protein